MWDWWMEEMPIIVSDGKEENMFGQWMGENRIVLENGFEDDDFEEKFLEWLNSKSEEEILEGMERIVRRARDDKN